MVDGSSMYPFTGIVRLTRGWVVGTIAVALSVSGHAIAGGATPSEGTLLALTVLAALPCAAASRLEWTARRLFGALLVIQGVLHLVFLMTAHQHHPTNTAVMLGWHVAATLVSVAVIRYAERTLAAAAGTQPLRRALRLLAHVFSPRRLCRRIGALVRVPALAGREHIVAPARAPPAVS